MAQADQVAETFGIYYLNYPKLMEINTSIDNRRSKALNVESSNAESRSNSSGISAQMGVNGPLVPYRAEAGVSMQHSANLTSSTGITETFEIKHTKSTELKQLLSRCQTCENGITNDYVGKLMRIDNVQLHLMDDSTMLPLQALRHDALKGMRVQGIDVSDMVNSILHDYAYILIGQSCSCEFALKIPSESTIEFENKYSIHDLLIGKVSVIGVFKGSIPTDQLLSNTLMKLQQQGSGTTESRVILSSIPESTSEAQKSCLQTNAIPTKIGYIDTIAIIQPIELSAPASERDEAAEPENTQPEGSIKPSFCQRIKALFSGE